ncbi:MAG TPA: hypothetical protein VF765_22830 [Polyangiaceae bacterium]
MNGNVAVVVATVMLLAACDRHSSTAAPQPPEPEPSASTVVQEVRSDGGSDASSAPTALAPSASAAVSAPSVKVENIGIHIGGGPNDPVTKAPIASSIEPHFDDLRVCWGSAGDPKRGGDFGVDLLIPSEGGRAQVSHPRTGIKGDAFRACVVAVFEQVDFKRPLTGRTTASYSLRFTP